MSRARLGRLRIAAATAFVVATLALQVEAVLARRWDRWPFVHYPMYGTSHPPGPIEVTRAAAFYRRESKARKRLRPAWGHSEWDFRRDVTAPLAAGDEGVAARVVGELDAAAPHDPVDLLRVDVERYRIPPGERLRVERYSLRYHVDRTDGALTVRRERTDGAATGAGPAEAP